MMNILTEIHRSPGIINLNGRIIHRTAVRAVILREQTLLMIHSSNVGDYKFPGGNVAAREGHTQALCREVAEESGMSVIRIGPEIGAIIEYDLPIENDFDVFKMTSHYYPCDVEDSFGTQTLDAYERDLGFKPVWIDIETAIQRNKALLASTKTPEWLRREIFILEYIQQNPFLFLNT